MKYNLFTGSCAGDFVRVTSCDTTEAVQKALDIHNTSPVCTAALGRFITGAMLMSTGLKNKTDSVTLQIKSRGPIGGLVAVSDSDGNVRGYCQHPQADLPLRADGKLDVGGIVGKGMLNVIKDLGLREPYGGTVELLSGEIAEDIAYYYSVSEQLPTVVALGVLVVPDEKKAIGYSIGAAGGYMLSLMPGAPDSLIDDLEARVSGFLPVTTMLSAGATIENVCEDLLHGLDYKVSSKKHAEYRCSCSAGKMRSVIKSLGREEISDMIEKDHGAEIVCHFCHTKYNFTEEELKAFISD